MDSYIYMIDEKKNELDKERIKIRLYDIINNKYMKIWYEKLIKIKCYKGLNNTFWQRDKYYKNMLNCS
jgi:hypothetical protein